MTEREVVEMQDKAEQKEFYLMLVGKFWHAYGYGAFALSRLYGCKVLLRERRWGKVPSAGFPIDSLPRVRKKLAECNGEMHEVEKNLLAFSGVDGTPFEIVVQPRNTAPSDICVQTKTGTPSETSPQEKSLREELMSFSVMNATPLEALNFLNTLQRRYGAE